MTPAFCCGMECGVTGAHFTLQNTSSFVTSGALRGARSLRCNPANGPGYGQSIYAATGGIFVARLYIKFTTLPNANTMIFSTSQHGNHGAVFNQADNKIYAGSALTTLGATGVSVTTGILYLLDVKINASSNPWTIDVQVNGTACAQITDATAANTNSASVNVGFVNTVGGDALIDDVIVSNTAADYPIGAGKVLAFVPAADGTHTFTSTHAILGTTGAPTTGSNITSATTNAFSFVNARPIGGGVADATRLWNQATLLSTEYAEVTIEQTTEVNPPRAVEVLCVAREASSTTCNSTFKVNDNGTENTVYAMTVPVGNSDEFKSKQYATMPADSAAWTLARFNGLRLRFGYSSDATPDVYCRGWMVEAEFPEGFQDASAFGRPEGQIGQGQMQQLLAQ